MGAPSRIVLRATARVDEDAGQPRCSASPAKSRPKRGRRVLERVRKVDDDRRVGRQIKRNAGRWAVGGATGRMEHVVLIQNLDNADEGSRTAGIAPR